MYLVSRVQHISEPTIRPVVVDVINRLDLSSNVYAALDRMNMTLQDLAQVSVPDVSITEHISPGVTKQCTKCKEYKELDLFYNNKSAKDGKQRYCKSCNAATASAYYKANTEKVAAKISEWYEANTEKVAAKTRAWKKENPEKTAAHNRAWYYNLTNERYQKLLEEQNNSCKICLKPFADTTPCVDHNHECCPGERSCGKCIRGLLCNACNRGLGHFKDNREYLRRADDYLGAA
jgi:hypothetical protein